MRRALAVLAVLVAVFVAALVLVPLLLKDRVVALVLGEVNARVDADVALGGADVSLIRSFPDLHVAVTDLAVVGRAPFAGVELARVGHLGVSLDLVSVLGGGPVRVTGLDLRDTRVNVLVDAEGRSNTDLGGATPEAPAEPAAAAPAGPSPELWLRDVALANVSLRYEDRTADRLVVVKDLALDGDAEVGGELVALRGAASIAALSVRDGGVDLVSEAKVGADLDVRYGPTTGAIQLGDNTLRVNELALAFAGAVTPEDAGTGLDLTFSADRTSFKSLLSLIPGAYTPDFGGVTADGALTVRGAVKGLLPDAGDDLPGFDLAVQVADGRFQYPGLPAAVSDIQLDLAVKHPGGAPDAMAVDLSRFRLVVDGSPLEGRLSLRTPISDPAVDTEVRGRLDLGRLAAAFPDAVTGWTGLLDVDLALAGKVSAFTAGDVDAVRAGGTFTLTDATWADPSQPMPINVQELKLTVDPRKVDLASFRLRFGDSDLAAAGRVDNAVGWLLADQVLAGQLEARSTKLDLNPWAGGSDDPAAGSTGAAEPTAAADSSLFVVPANVDLSFALDAGQVLYDGWDLRDVRGRLRVKDGAVALEDLRSRTLGGEIALSGTYRAPTAESADVDLRVSATDVGAAAAIAQLETVRKMLPGLENVTGRLRTGFGVKARLGKDLRPDLATLASVGTLGAAGLKVSPGFLKPVAEFVGDDRFTALALEGGDIGFQVEGGKLKVDRVPVALGPAKGVLRGKTGVLDESLDLSLDLAVPASAVKGGEAAKALLGRSVDTVDLTAAIGGTWKAPKVKVGLGDTLRGAVDEAVEEVKAVVEEKVGAVVDDLVAKAKAQGDTLIAEAEKQAAKLRQEGSQAADRVRTEADKQANKLVREAKGNPLKEAAAKEAAKKLRSEADKQADKLEKEADKQADAAVAAAKKQRDQLVKDAEAKMGR